LPMSGVGEILKAVGDFGLFQKRLVLLTVVPCLSVAFHQFCQLFMVPNLPHHCDTSWIRAIGPNLTEEEQLNLTLPRDADGEYEQCSRYSPVDWDLGSIMEYGLNATEKCIDGWVYPSAQPPSLLTEFDLVCDRRDLDDISQAVYMMGLFLGCMIFGPLSDRIGRRPVILISISLQALFGVGIAFVPHFYVYMAFRCVVGASVTGITVSMLALATEWIGVTSRPTAVLVSHCCFAIGEMILAGLSYGIRHWRLLQIAGSAPIFAFFFYTHTAPWGTGTLRAAVVLLQVFQSGLGGLKVEYLDPLHHLVMPTACWAWPQGAGLWKSCRCRSILYLLMDNRTCSVPLCLDFRFVNSLVYYGLSLNVTNFGVDIYLTQLAFGAVEIPARVGCIFVLQRFGRRKPQAILMLLSGLVCLIISGIPEDQAVVITILAITGKFTASSSFSTSYVYTAELFPTVIRQTGVGLCSMAARVSGILAPLLLLLGQYHRVIPMAIFGGVPMVGGLLCFLLPETGGTELADDT
ncbi:Solute carrier family 22 member 13, partial [Calypte anna]